MVGALCDRMIRYQRIVLFYTRSSMAGELPLVYV
jgi:hypothetical protein